MSTHNFKLIQITNATFTLLNHEYEGVEDDYIFNLGEVEYLFGPIRKVVIATKSEVNVNLRRAEISKYLNGEHDHLESTVNFVHLVDVKRTLDHLLTRLVFNDVFDS